MIFANAIDCPSHTAQPSTSTLSSYPPVRFLYASLSGRVMRLAEEKLDQPHLPSRTLDDVTLDPTRRRDARLTPQS